MFNSTESNYTTPAFIAKLWEMVNDNKYDNLIQWCDDGDSFVIKDQTRFCSELLPIYYKHNNMASFIRQLNKYGFRKVVPLDSVSLKNDRNDLEFSHPYFLRDCPALLFQIKRKIPHNKEVSYSNVMASLAQQVQQLQQKQNIFETKLSTMKNENNALWREHSLLRHKHQKLQKIVNQLIQFLLTLVQQSRGLNIKRKPATLMIKDSSQFPNDGLNSVSGYSFNNCIAINSDELNEVITEANTSGSLPNVFTVSNDSGDNNLQYEIPVYPGPSGNGPKINKTTNPKSAIAVPLYKVSPAIVYGKYAGKNTIVGGDMNKRKVTTPLENPTSNKKVKKEQKLGAGKAASYSIIKPRVTNIGSRNNIKSGIKSEKNITSNKHIIVEKEAVVPPKSGKAVKYVLQSLNNDDTLPENIVLPSTGDINTMSISDVSSPFVIEKYNDSDEEEVPIFGQNSICDVEDINSLPIILSPSGAQLSPMPLENTEKSDHQVNSTAENSLSPMQKEFGIDNLHNDLDLLKDLLQGEGFSIDASTLFGLFNNEDPLSFSMPEAGPSVDNNSSLTGNELVTYNTPSLIDIVDNEVEDKDEFLEFRDQDMLEALNTPKAEWDFSYPSPSNTRKK